MPNFSTFVTNQRSSYKVVQGAAALTKTISTTPIIGASDSALAPHANTEVFLVQVNTNDVWLSLHGETPSATTALNLVAGTILEMSRSQWSSAIWKRSGAADSVLVALQLRAS